jgi:hypothetical protein
MSTYNEEVNEHVSREGQKRAFRRGGGSKKNEKLKLERGRNVLLCKRMLKEGGWKKKTNGSSE